MSQRGALVLGWCLAIGAAVGVRLWNALTGPLLWGYDAWGHVSYALFLDLYRALPWADQGWSYFHPPLHYLFGWALAQAGSGEVLARGLSLVGSAASLATAGLAAWMVRAAAPARPGLALVGFGAVAFLPVHLFMSPMPGNELTECLLTAAALTALVANERRARPTLAGAALVGALAGAALLAKFSGLLTLCIACGALALRACLRGAWSTPAKQALARAATVTAVAVALAAPYYARNLEAFGTPFQLSRDFPLVAQVERDQPPGRRSVLDYLRLPAATFTDPNPLAPHLLGSVWGSVYLNVWADTYRESDVARALEAEREQRRSTSAMALLGLVPTGLALAGVALGARDVRRGRRREVYLPLAVQAGISLAAFVAFSWHVPLWSALKASYLFGLSLPFAVALARGIEGCLGAGRLLRALGPASLVAVAVASSLVATDGLVLPRRADAPAAGALHFYFGELDAARRIYGRLIAGSRTPVPWLDNLAAVEIADGNPALARRLLARAVELERAAGHADPYRRGRLAVAMALDGDLAGAESLLDEILAEHPLPELRANRGVIRAARGDLAGAEEDLASLATVEPGPPAVVLGNLARVEDALGRGDEARELRVRARLEACRPPRGYAYGVGTGEVLEWGIARRPLLIWEEGGLRSASPQSFRRSCA